jgi:prevent-host-death family protein
VAITTDALRTVKDRFSEYVDPVEREHERVVVTRNGRPAIVLISTEDLERLEETIDVLSDATAMAGIAKTSPRSLAATSCAALTPCEPSAAEVTETYELVVAAPAARALAEELPEAFAHAVIDLITGPRLDDPNRVGRQLRR